MLQLGKKIQKSEQRPSVKVFTFSSSLHLHFLFRTSHTITSRFFRAEVPTHLDRIQLLFQTGTSDALPTVESQQPNPKWEKNCKAQNMSSLKYWTFQVTHRKENGGELEERLGAILTWKRNLSLGATQLSLLITVIGKEIERESGHFLSEPDLLSSHDSPGCCF